MRATAHFLRSLYVRYRFRLWVTRLRLELRRHGMRLEVECPAPVHFDGPPTIKVFSDAERRKATMRLQIGRNVTLGRGMTLEIYAVDDLELEIGDQVRFSNNVRILFRGGTVRLGSDTLVRDGVWIKADGELRTGREVTIGPYSALHSTELIELADLVGIGERVSIIDSDHTFDGTDEHYMKKPLTVSPVRLGRQTMIAFGSIVLRGAEIGPNSVVAANSVVRGGEYPEASLLAGNPAKLIKDLRERESGP